MADQGRATLTAFREAGGRADRPEVEELVRALGERAPALAPLILRDPTIIDDVLSRPLDHGDDEAGLRDAFLTATRGLGDGPELRSALRRLRHRAAVRIAAREVLRLADVDRTSAEMAWLGAAALDAAIGACTRTLFEKHGRPVDTAGRTIPFVALGMGKLGGTELNLGSDIDLCFFYETDDATVVDDATGEPRPDETVHEVYARVASRASAALSEPTEDGFVFRVDLRLRPEGTRGPLVNSLASAERYYATFGRTWERAALLRARPVAGDLAFGDRLLAMLEPFVYRRSVDPTVASQMAEMLRRSRRELGVDAHDVKLGEGGIREAEFVAQTLQLVWGGTHPELRVRGTVEAIRRLVGRGLLSHREGTDLEADWALLRRIEHRIHVSAGYQTHRIPEPGPRRNRFAQSLGFADSAALERELDAARARVTALFASLAPSSDPTADAHDRRELADLCDRVAAGASPAELAGPAAALLPVVDPDAAGAHLARLGRRADAPLGPATRDKLSGLGPLLLSEVTQATDPDRALRYLADFFSRLRGTWSYDRLLWAEPTVARRLVGLFGASATLSEALVAHPEWLDELLVGSGGLTAAGVHALHDEPPLTDADPPPDQETMASALRRRKMLATVQVGLAYVGDEIDLAGVSERLTALADAQIRAALAWATAHTVADLGAPDDDVGLVVLGLGKLGAAEMGFGSDLDLSFVYGAEGTTTTSSSDREPTTHGELFTRIAQRTMRVLSQPDASGPGFETDTRLRPSGSQGMLVVSHDAFVRYHEERAEPWERQVLLRARPVAGDPELGQLLADECERWAFEGQPPEPDEVARTRARIQNELAGERAGRFHPKLGYGGLVDVEFVVQWLQMRHGDDPRVRRRDTLGAIAKLAEAGHLSSADAATLRDGWDLCRGIEQTLRLMDEKDGRVAEGGRVWDRIAARLALRDRDGERKSAVLSRTWRRSAGAVREVFERVLATVPATAPWERP